MFGYPDTLDSVDLTNPLAEHPLNEARVGWWLGLPPLDGGAQWYDLVRGRTAALQGTGGSAYKWGPTGRVDSGVTFDGSTGYAKTAAFTTVAPLSAAIWVYPTSSTGEKVFGQWDDGPSTYSWIMVAGINSFGLNVVIGTGSNNGYYLSYGSLPANTWSRLLATCTASGNIQLYINGTSTGGSTSTYSSNPGGSIPLTIGAGLNSPGADNLFPGGLSDASLWNRVLSPAEVLADYDLSRRGYPGVLRRNRPLSIFVGGGGTTYTLNGSPGTFTVTADTAEFSIGVALGIGSYSVTGDAAQIAIALEAALATYSVSGYAASLVPTGSYTLNGSPGTFTVSGSPVEIDIGLGTSIGLFSVTGDAVQISSVFNTSLGTFSVTGSPIETSLVLNVGYGTYSVTGSGANLVIGGSFVLNALPGTFVVTGYQANLVNSGSKIFSTIPLMGAGYG